MSLNPFATVSDYKSMLNKIALYTFGVTLLTASWIYFQIPSLGPRFLRIEVAVPEVSIKVPLVVLGVAFLVAWVSRSCKLHDRLSDLFGIRRRFDLEVILFPLAAASGAALTLTQQVEVRENREQLMGEVFYEYATSSPGKAVIESHTIAMALDQWSWYWVVLEADAVFSIAAVIFFWNGFSQQSSVLLLIVLISILALRGFRHLCSGYATDEIRQILKDPQRKQAIEWKFRAL